MPLSSRRLLRSMLVAIAAVLLGCGSDSKSSSQDPNQGPNSDLVAYLWDTWGIRLNDIRGWDENYQDLGGGKWTTSAEFETELKDRGKRAMLVEEDVEPVGSGTDVTMFVVDVESGVQRYFEYNQAENYVIIGNLDVSVAVSSNPDGTFDVWTLSEDANGNPRDQQMTMDDGYAAYAEVARRNGFANIPQHIVLTAFAVAHASMPTGRSVVDCGGNYGTQLGSYGSYGAQISYLSSSFPVCTIFEAFCNCAACQALQKTDGKCAKCPSI